MSARTKGWDGTSAVHEDAEAAERYAREYLRQWMEKGDRVVVVDQTPFRLFVVQTSYCEDTDACCLVHETSD